MPDLHQIRFPILHGYTDWQTVTAEDYAWYERLAGISPHGIDRFHPDYLTKPVTTQFGGNESNVQGRILECSPVPSGAFSPDPVMSNRSDLVATVPEKPLECKTPS